MKKTWNTRFGFVQKNYRLWLKVGLGRGTWELGDVGTQGCGRRAGTQGHDKQTTPEFYAEFVKYNFWRSSVRWSNMLYSLSSDQLLMISSVHGSSFGHRIVSMQGVLNVVGRKSDITQGWEFCSLWYRLEKGREKKEKDVITTQGIRIWSPIQVLALLNRA